MHLVFQNSERSAALALIGEAYFKQEGKLDNLTVADLQEFGAHAVYLLPPRYFETMSEEVFDHVYVSHFYLKINPFPSNKF